MISVKGCMYAYVKYEEMWNGTWVQFIIPEVNYLSTSNIFKIWRQISVWLHEKSIQLVKSKIRQREVNE